MCTKIILSIGHLDVEIKAAPTNVRNKTAKQNAEPRKESGPAYCLEYFVKRYEKLTFSARRHGTYRPQGPAHRCGQLPLPSK